jgi:hypothetical protein
MTSVCDDDDDDDDDDDCAAVASAAADDDSEGKLRPRVDLARTRACKKTNNPPQKELAHCCALCFCDCPMACADSPWVTLSSCRFVSVSLDGDYFLQTKESYSFLLPNAHRPRSQIGGSGVFCTTHTQARLIAQFSRQAARGRHIF